MGKGTRGNAARRAIGREIQRRASRLHEDAVEVIASYYDLASRYQQLVNAVDVFWDDLPEHDDALLDVHEALGLEAVVVALEAAAQRFEDAGLTSFASGVRDVLAPTAPPISVLKAMAPRHGPTRQ
jgi:hypothetical protein